MARMRPDLRPGQFALRALFIATAFVAAACGAVQFIRSTEGPTGRLAAELFVPFLFFGAVGAFRGQVQTWLGYGVIFVCIVVALALLI